MPDAVPPGGGVGRWRQDRARVHRDQWGEFYTIQGDGNCAFRCLSLAIWGAEEQHGLMRTITVCHVASQWPYYQHLAEFPSADLYRSHMAEGWGGSAEVHAAGWRFDRTVVIVEDGEVRFYRVHPGDEEPVVLRRSQQHFDLYLSLPKGLTLEDLPTQSEARQPVPSGKFFAKNGRTAT